MLVQSIGCNVQLWPAFSHTFGGHELSWSVSSRVTIRPLDPKPLADLLTAAHSLSQLVTLLVGGPAHFIRVDAETLFREEAYAPGGEVIETEHPLLVQVVEHIGLPREFVSVQGVRQR